MWRPSAVYSRIHSRIHIQYLIVVFKGIHCYIECGYGCVHNGTDTEDCAVSYIL